METTEAAGQYRDSFCRWANEAFSHIKVKHLRVFFYISFLFSPFFCRCYYTLSYQEILTTLSLTKEKHLVHDSAKKSKQNTTCLFVLTSSFPRHCPPATLYFMSNTFSLTNNAQWQPYKCCYFVIVAQLPLVCFFTKFLTCYIYTKPHTILIYVCKASAGAELLKNRTFERSFQCGEKFFCWT